MKALIPDSFHLPNVVTIQEKIKMTKKKFKFLMECQLMKGRGSLTCFEGFCTAACRDTEVKNKNASLPLPALLCSLQFFSIL